MKKVQESKIIGYQKVHGKDVPIIQPEVHTEVKHKLTGKEYNSKEEAQQDVADPNTETKDEHIEENVMIKVIELPEMGGDVNI
jgi:hypothetical protein|tara:strand:+ start:493 stop:741 length:249 start_codon:yes stop_codon:yes gene_type:complete